MSGRIPENEIDAVRAATDLVALAGERMALKRVGRRYVGLCPFHDEKTPSFSINPDSALYYCFGCGESGNAFQFLMRLDGLSFVEAVEWLARRAGIAITFRDESGEDRRKREARPRLQRLLEVAARFYASALTERPDAKLARQHLSARGLDKTAAARFGLGYAPDEWDATVKALKAAGFLSQEMVDAGVASHSSRGGVVDLLRGRLVFPISDSQGAPVAFAGRRLSDDESAGPKYLNSPETTLYHKSRTLYGLGWARPEIVARNAAVIVEGYTDVIGFHLAGTGHAVATCGTALGEDHLRLLKRYAGRVILAFDGDAAGAAATERTFGVAAQLGLDMRVALLPSGKDPADVAIEGDKAVADLLKDPKPLLEFKVERELDRAVLDSSEGEIRALDAATRAIALHPDPLVRGSVGRQLARRLRDVTEDQVLAAVEAVRASSPNPHAKDTRLPVAAQATQSPQVAQPKGSGPVRLPRVEQYALASLIQMPGPFLDTAPDFSPDWFGSEAGRHIASAVYDRLSTSNSSNSLNSLEAVDVQALELETSLADMARRLAVVQAPGVDDAVLHATETALALERRWLGRRIGELQHAQHAAEADGAWASVKALDSELVTFIARLQALGET